jgi:hypothetical protein
MSEYTVSPGAVNMPSVIPAPERALSPGQHARDLVGAINDAATARRQRLSADAIPATPTGFPGRVTWYHIDGPRYDGAYQVPGMQARAECGQIVFAAVPYSFNSDLRSILARYYRGRWQLRIDPSNARRVATWLAWWHIMTDEAAVELMRSAVQG